MKLLTFHMTIEAPMKEMSDMSNKIVFFIFKD